MVTSLKPALKNMLGEIPLTAELYWSLRQTGRPVSGNFSLRRLEKHLPAWRTQAEANRRENSSGRRVLIFATQRYWIEHAALLGIALAGMGHKVTLAYLPYAHWKKPLNRFDLRQQNAYALKILSLVSPLVEILPLLNARKITSLPADIQESIQQLAIRDTQYTLQVEQVDLEGELYQLRWQRDTEAAQASFAWMQAHHPEVVIIPNGSILEFGALYQVARYFDRQHFPVTVVTYEFGEQRQRIWLAQNSEVMHQDTGGLWDRRKNQPLSAHQLAQVQSLFAARQGANLWENFARRWQGVPMEGGERVRASLSLDRPGDERPRPVVLLATNDIGDSLTLGRQVFSDSMTEWLRRTVSYFARRPDVQLVIRIHPGEMITKGPSVAYLIHRTLLEQAPEIPEHIHIVPADAQVNTYDIVEIVDLGLVYTTTVGMEMAMSGVPVIAVGRTHYRGRGFTLDVGSWDSYFELLDHALAEPERFRLTQAQVELAWNYAYRFFFEYPHPFPWHLLNFWKDQEIWPPGRVLSDEGQGLFKDTFDYLAGEPVKW